MIKAVFFDVDGTLVSFKNHQIPKSTERAIQLLKEKGIKVFISTGRSINFIYQLDYLDFDGYITFNGGYCQTKSGEVLFKKYINPEDIQAIIKYDREVESINFAFMNERRVSINKYTPQVDEMFKMLNMQKPVVEDYSDFDINTQLQVNLFVDPSKEHELMQDVMVNSIATRWSPLFIDVNPLGQSKKRGVQAFIEHLGLDWSETMSFGDGGNDIEMLKATEIGIAMGNANPEVKLIADYITDDIDEDGVYNALKHFKII